MGTRARWLILTPVLLLVNACSPFPWTAAPLTPVAAVGRPVPLLSLPTLDGGSATLASFHGHPLVVNVWASWCGPCRAEQTDLLTVYSRYSGEGVRFLGVDYRDDSAQARAFRAELKVPYPSAIDESGQAMQYLGMPFVPGTLFITADGVLAERLVGAQSEADLDRAISRDFHL
ncbi:MAG: TlpA family protein disulfide reductase [Candidatus Dormibacteria bacterium]